MIEFRKLLYILPNLSIGCVENMCTVLVYLNSQLFLCINITCYMISFVNNQADFPLLLHLMGKNGTEQSRPHNQIIVMHDGLLTLIFYDP